MTFPGTTYAIATSSLGYIYQVTGFPDQAIKIFCFGPPLLMLKTATMETVALRNLAIYFMQK